MSQRLVNGQIVTSAEASEEFVNFWVSRVDPNYVSPYPDDGRRRLEAFYF